MHTLNSARDAGNIKRYHSWPTLQTQTNAHHSWNVIRIYFELFGQPSQKMFTYLTYHDVGELDTGDISFVVKRKTPIIKELLAPTENKAIERLSRGYAKFDMLSDVEKIQAKICDLVEMLEFSLEECRLGNVHYGKQIFENIYDVLEEILVNRGVTDNVDYVCNLLLDQMEKYK